MGHSSRKPSPTDSESGLALGSPPALRSQRRSKRRKAARYVPCTYDGTGAEKFLCQAASQEVGASSISPSSENDPGSVKSAVSSTTVTSAGLLTDCTMVRSRAAPLNP